MSTTISGGHKSIGLPLFLALVGHVPLLAAPWVTFTEISYRPAGNEALEFVEIYNLEAPYVDLTGWKLEGEVEFEFPRGLRLPPKHCVVVARDLVAFKKHYPGIDNVIGPYRGALDNHLFDAADCPLVSGFVHDDLSNAPPAATINRRPSSFRRGLLPAGP